MKARLPLVVLLAGSLAFLASLYLPWAGDYEGWSLALGEIGALLAVLLAGACAAAVRESRLAGQLPIGRAALALGYLGCGSLLAIRAEVHQEQAQFSHLPSSFHGVPTFPTPSDHYDAGAYLALGSGVALLLGAAALRRSELAQRRSAREVAIAVLGIGLLVALAVLPWIEVAFGHVRFTMLGVEGSLGTLAAVSACLAISSRTSRTRLFAALSALVFTVAAFSPSNWSPFISHGYGAWLGLGLSPALATGLVVEARRKGALPKPSRSAGLTLAPGLLLLAALFLPWSGLCYPDRHSFGPVAGVCVSANGWSQTLGTAVGLLVVVLVALLLSSRRASPVAELAVAVGVFVSAIGSEQLFGYDRSYGAYVGFVCAGLLLGVALARAGWRRPEKRRLLVRLLPIAACLLSVLALVVPLWAAGLFERLRLEVYPSSWQGVALVALSIWLLGSWIRRTSAPPVGRGHLAFIAAAMLAVLGLVLVANRGLGITWSSGALVGILLVLVLLGWIEEREGLESLSEMFRVDRIPDPEPLAED